ncbi:hypothetical protein EDWATA_00841 [Edwardsiella tarda ATCC 23685]|uniref:Uncharacterized protein n=1 Tax=Edwardsiella tarda ATCC 23685 TaxID=500638 RepID=D4F297_EDWTA|nr:hypothetical protein EDWATA_00841 [Edwardsiella tarda ATCC 23685]
MEITFLSFTPRSCTQRKRQARQATSITLPVITMGNHGQPCGKIVGATHPIKGWA